MAVLHNGALGVIYGIQKILGSVPSAASALGLKYLLLRGLQCLLKDAISLLPYLIAREKSCLGEPTETDKAILSAFLQNAVTHGGQKDKRLLYQGC